MKYNFYVLLLITCVVFSQDNTPEFLEAIAYQQYENKTTYMAGTEGDAPEDLIIVEEELLIHRSGYWCIQ